MWNTRESNNPNCLELMNDILIKAIYCFSSKQATVIECCTWLCSTNDEWILCKPTWKKYNFLIVECPLKRKRFPFFFLFSLCNCTSIVICWRMNRKSDICTVRTQKSLKFSACIVDELYALVLYPHRFRVCCNSLDALYYSFIHSLFRISQCSCSRWRKNVRYACIAHVTATAVVASHRMYTPTRKSERLFARHTANGKRFVAV